jgi:TonB family protein
MVEKPSPSIALAPGALELDLGSLPTLEMPRFGDANTFELPPAPLQARNGDPLQGYALMSPAMIPPDIRNRGEVARFLSRSYRRILRGREMTGVAVLHFWIDESGDPQRATLVMSSGNVELDTLALSLPSVIRFRPARRGKVPVPVIAMVPIRFETGPSAASLLEGRR